MSRKITKIEPMAQMPTRQRVVQYQLSIMLAEAPMYLYQIEREVKFRDMPGLTTPLIQLGPKQIKSHLRLNH